MSIDWSKAPEGSNKAGFTGPDNYLQFYRIPGMFGDYDYWSEGRGWLGSEFPTCANYLFERPAKVEWDGQGLPPVGTVCEHYGTADDLAWLEVEVIGHGNVDGRNVAFFRYGTGSPRFTVSYSTANNFRPIRTPEQVAAEERAQAVKAMLALDPPHDNGLGLTSRQQFCEILYDHGYRRQEGGK
ncbi:hypothetical protein N1F33_19215 [Pseudomonas aeruginosa]|uniref:hypothetical protein n=1 Tax=Pseudomonas aeruginosa TaxID=287 RepID=UPI001A2C084C|nr:hypothetical protein [Pseudomonas aeruginosa]MBH9437772.1 hypothetical protein [Pseudomonas aeruginosa]MCS8109577.1 hypothetical protein [Pseudomonas aeruginosa]MCS8762515.1 hypothetical protein [Pseudomonas aeruginosa]MCS8929560.1 hypothetical protein [Pseudomonas aeruginosa]